MNRLKEEITLAHGGGGTLTQELVDTVFRPAFGPGDGHAPHDSAELTLDPLRLAFTTDVHVVSPLEFPGGDIGRVAVFGTVNDLLMAGARPRWLSAGFILEEGLPIDRLRRIAASMGEAAREAGVAIVAGDTKVVERGKGDGLYVATSGVGVLEHELSIRPESIRPGDAILLSGDVGRHGMAILAQRAGLAFDAPIRSDCAPLTEAVMGLLDGGIEVHCLRDLTRGGLATVLVELAESSGLDLAMDEAAVPVCESVRGACEILGLDPFYVANEGRFVAMLPAAQAGRALEILSSRAPGGPAVRIGGVRGASGGRAILRTVIGAERLLDRLTGDQLPRIC